MNGDDQKHIEKKTWKTNCDEKRWKNFVTKVRSGLSYHNFIGMLIIFLLILDAYRVPFVGY